MIGVSQANRLLHFISIIKEKGGREVSKNQTATTFTNPFAVNADAAPYIFITKKAVVKFGHTLTGASMLTERRMNEIMGAKL